MQMAWLRRVRAGMGAEKALLLALERGERVPCEADRALLLSAVERGETPFANLDDRRDLRRALIEAGLALKKVGNDAIASMIKSGEMAKIYDKWFVQPIPPTNTRVGLPLSEATKAAWANPNDKPVEEYAKK